jgi:hypothetical protein
LLLIQSDTLLCFDKIRAAEISNFTEICRRDSFRLNKALLRESSLNRILEVAETEIVVKDSLISALEAQIMLGDSEVNRLVEDCRIEKRNRLIVGALGGAALVALLGAVFGGT